jgi:hypothetical protein
MHPAQGIVRVTHCIHALLARARTLYPRSYKILHRTQGPGYEITIGPNIRPGNVVAPWDVFNPDVSSARGSLADRHRERRHGADSNTTLKNDEELL